MAFRSSSSTSFTGTTSLTASAPTGVTSGDYLGAILSQNATAPTITPPTGWTQQGGTGNDLTVDGQTIRYFDKIATGSDSYAWTSSSTGETTIQVFAHSGRAASGAQIVLSKSNVANTSVVSIGATGLTAPANADLVWLVASDQVTSTDIWSYTAPTGYTQQQNVSTSTTASAVTLCTKDAVSAGATGTITGSCTITTGTERMGWGAFVISIPILGPTITQQPVSTNILDNNVATFTVTATGTGGLSYQWKNNGNNVGTNSATYSQVGYLTDNGDSITVDVTDSNGTTTSNAAILSVVQRNYAKFRRSTRSSRFEWSGAGSFDTKSDASGWFHKWLMQPATSSGGAVNYSLSGVAGSYSITGRAATFKVGRAMSGVAGSYTITGRASTLSLARKMAGVTGSYSVSGQAVTFKTNRLLSGAAGSYSLTGNAATLNYTPGSGAVNYTLSGAAGSYAVTGRAATFNVGHALAGSAGSYAITGRAATLSLTRNLAGVAGSYSITGRAATFNVGHALSGAAGAYVVTGRTATLTYTPGNLPFNYTLSGDAGAYLLTGNDTTFTVSQLATLGGHGISRPKRDQRKPGIAIEAFGQIHYFDTEEEAEAWLAEQLPKHKKQAKKAARRIAREIGEPNALTSSSYSPIRMVSGPPEINAVVRMQSQVLQRRFDYVAYNESQAKKLQDEEDEALSVFLMME